MAAPQLNLNISMACNIGLEVNWRNGAHIEDLSNLIEGFRTAMYGQVADALIMEQLHALKQDLVLVTSLRALITIMR